MTSGCQAMRFYIGVYAGVEKNGLLLYAINKGVMLDMDMDMAIKFETQIEKIVGGVSAAATELEATTGTLAIMAKERTAGHANNVAAARCGHRVGVAKQLFADRCQ